MADSQANPFAAPAEARGSAVVYNPSRSLYESLRVLHIAITVIAARCLMIPFEPTSSTMLTGRLTVFGVIAAIVVVACYLLLRELRAYWSQDATKERDVVRLHSSFSLLLMLITVVMAFSRIGGPNAWAFVALLLNVGWHISAVFRESMLRQRLRFAVAQAGDPTSTSLALALPTGDTSHALWGSVNKTGGAPVIEPKERPRMLLVWLRQCLFTRKGLAVLAGSAVVLIGGCLLANWLIPVEVAGCELSCDGDYLVASLHKKRGALYAKCVDSQCRQTADGDYQQQRVVREVCVGSSTSVMFGEPSISCGVSPYQFTFRVGNRTVAQYDGVSRQFSDIE